MSEYIIRVLIFLLFLQYMHAQEKPVHLKSGNDINWDKIELTGAEAKLLPVIGPSKFPVWIPVTAGVLGIGTGVYLLLKDKKKSSDAEIPIARNDAFSLMCGMSHEVDPLANDSGSVLQIISISGAPAGLVILSNNKITISDEAGGTFTFSYTISNKDGKTASAMIAIDIMEPVFSVSNLNLRIVSGNTQNGNVFAGAMCEQCFVKNVTGPSEPVIEWNASGGFSLSPINLLPESREFQYRFTIEGKCKNEITVLLTLTVDPRPCSVTPQFESTPAQCDMDDGQIKLLSDDLGDYAFLWVTGQNTSSLLNIPAGMYMVTITHSALACVGVFTVEVAERDADYIRDISISAGNCYQSGKLILDISGVGPFRIDISGSDKDFHFEVPPGNHDLAALMEPASEGKPVTGTFNIAVRDLSKDNRCTQRITAEIPVGPVSFLLKDDIYTANQNTPLTGNVLQNDEGVGLRVVEFNQIPGASLNIENNGIFNFTGNSGIYEYQYTVRDSCGRLMSAKLKITVSNIICSYNASFSVTPAVCGVADGSAVISVMPADPVTITWSNGAVGNILSGVMSAVYTVTVTHPTGACQQVFSVSIPQTQHPYINHSDVIDESCNQKAEIILNLTGPASGILTITAIGPVATFTFTVPSGNVLVSNFVTLIPGLWTLVINDAAAPPSCAQNYNFILQSYQPLLLTLLDIEPPSSPTAKDGIVYVEITGGNPPYSISAPGMTFNNLLPGFNILKGFPSGVFTLFAVDAAGCNSNVIIVEMFGGKPALKPHISITPFLPVLLAHDVEPEHPSQTKPEHTLIAIQTLQTSFISGDNYLSVGAGSSLPLNSYLNTGTGNFDLKVLMFEAGKQWSSADFYTQLSARYQYQHFTGDSKVIDKNSSNTLYNLSLKAGLNPGSNLNILFFIDWYPDQKIFAGGNTVRYLF